MSLSRRGFVLGEDGPNLGHVDDLADGFKAYHQTVARDTAPEPTGVRRGTPTLQEHLDRWHDRLASYNVVANALPNVDLPYGSERLITLPPFRPWKSWVRIEGRFLKGRTLRVAVAYGGDSGPNPPTYEYTFELR